MITLENNILRLNVGSELDIYQVEELVKKITSSFITLNRIEVDLSQTDKIDTSCFQLLMSVKKSCELTQKEFLITATSKAVENLLELFGYELPDKKEEQ